MYIRNYTSKNQKAAYYMVNKALLVLLPMAIGTSPACLAEAGLPRCGGRACQLSKEN
jgi:hypothetical protein